MSTNELMTNNQIKPYDAEKFNQHNESIQCNYVFDSNHPEYEKQPFHVSKQSTKSYNEQSETNHSTNYIVTFNTDTNTTSIYNSNLNLENKRRQPLISSSVRSNNEDLTRDCNIPNYSSIYQDMSSEVKHPKTFTGAILQTHSPQLPVPSPNYPIQTQMGIDSTYNISTVSTAGTICDISSKKESFVYINLEEAKSYVPKLNNNYITPEEPSQNFAESNTEGLNRDFTDNTSNAEDLNCNINKHTNCVSAPGLTNQQSNNCRFIIKYKPVVQDKVNSNKKITNINQIIICKPNENTNLNSNTKPVANTNVIEIPNVNKVTEAMVESSSTPVECKNHIQNLTSQESVIKVVPRPFCPVKPPQVSIQNTSNAFQNFKSKEIKTNFTKTMYSSDNKVITNNVSTNALPHLDYTPYTVLNVPLLSYVIPPVKKSKMSKIDIATLKKKSLRQKRLLENQSRPKVIKLVAENPSNELRFLKAKSVMTDYGIKIYDYCDSSSSSMYSSSDYDSDSSEVDLWIKSGPPFKSEKKPEKLNFLKTFGLTTHTVKSCEYT